MNTWEFLAALQQLNVQLRVKDGRLIINAPKGALSPDLRAELRRRKPEIIALLTEAGRGEEETAVPAIQPAPRNQPLPLSFAQQRLWFLDQLEPGLTAYNITRAMRTSGWLQPDILEQCLQTIVERHEILRTTIVTEKGQPRLQVHPQVNIKLQKMDLRGAPDIEVALQTAANEENSTPFKLDQDIPIRAKLLQTGEEEFVFLLSMHHIATDAWSIDILNRELAYLYFAYASETAPDLPHLPIQYPDFTIWQRELLQGEALERQLAYWRNQLSGKIPPLNLPTDYPRPVMQSFYGALHQTVLPFSTLTKLQLFAQQENASLYMITLTAFKVLLARYTHQTDILVGTPVTNRSNTDLEKLIGLFVNTLVIRTKISAGVTFRQLLAQVRDTILAAHAHQDIPFEKLVEELQPARNLSHTPFFQVLFNFQKRQQLAIAELAQNNTPSAPLAHAISEWFDFGNQTVQFDLNMNVYQNPENLTIDLLYNTDLFSPETTMRFLQQYERLLQGVLQQPDTPVRQIPLLAEAELQQIIHDWNATERSYPQDTCLHELFAQQAARTPEKTAVSQSPHTLTYQQLDQRANQLAHYLQSLGITPDDRVGIFMHRIPDLLVALLGVLKAGAAYVPLDPAFPTDRLAFMAADAQLKLQLTQQELLGDLPSADIPATCIDRDWPIIAAFPDQAADYPARAENLAYVIYTSGSTGRPKGVAITHRNVVNFLLSMQEEPGCSADETLLAITTLSFDISVLELFLPLISGGRVILADSATASDPDLLARLLTTSGTTMMQATPATWRMLIDSGWQGDLPTKQQPTILCGGEALPRDLADQLLARSDQVWNLYGPTECTVWSTLHRVQLGERAVPIGRPIANTQVLILDEHLQPVPIGVLGDLYIGGDGLAREYLNRPELTAEKFIGNPLHTEHGARLYHTGDLARYLPNGDIDFIGRCDFQVKVRGYRIELGEIEALLLQYPVVKEAVVIPWKEDVDKQLVAYLIVDDPHPTVEALRRFLKRHLPHYMIPGQFLFLNAFPLTPNLKVDRSALPEPTTNRSNSERPYVTPRNVIESRLVQIWEKMLEVQPIGIEDDFFTLGGHSLLAVHLFAEIEASFGTNLPLAKLFEGPTISHLAAAISRQMGRSEWSSLVPVQAEGTKRPFFCIHGITGDILWFRELAGQLKPANQPFYGLQARGLDGVQEPISTVPEMAAHYIKELRRLQPEGPYFLGGASFGGTIAYEMAQQLTAAGEEVALLAMFDDAPPNVVLKNSRRSWARFYRMLKNIPRWLNSMRQLRRDQIWARIRRQLRLFGHTRLNRNFAPDQIEASDIIDYADELPAHRRHLIKINHNAMLNYYPQPSAKKVILFRARNRPLFSSYDPAQSWQALVGEKLILIEIPGSHEHMFQQPHVRQLARELQNAIDSCLKE